MLSARTCHSVTRSSISAKLGGVVGSFVDQPLELVIPAALPSLGCERRLVLPAANQVEELEEIDALILAAIVQRLLALEPANRDPDELRGELLECDLPHPRLETDLMCRIVELEPLGEAPALHEVPRAEQAVLLV